MAEEEQKSDLDKKFGNDLKLFVGSLSYVTDDAKFKAYFEKFGELTDHIVMRYRDSGKSRGFGFVTFKAQEAYDACLGHQGHELDLAKIDIKRIDESARPRKRGFDEMEGEAYGPEMLTLRKLFVGGLSKETTKEEVKEYFSKFGEITDVIVNQTPQGFSKGFGFVTFAKAGDLDEAQKNRPHEINSRKLETKRATPKTDNISPRSTVTKLFVKRLGESVTEDDLKDYFGQFGTIVSVEQKSWNGVKKDYATIEFDDYDAVDKIVLVGRHNIKDRRLEVRKMMSKEELTKLKRSKMEGDSASSFQNRMMQNPRMMMSMMMEMMQSSMGGGGGGGNQRGFGSDGSWGANRQRGFGSQGNWNSGGGGGGGASGYGSGGSGYSTGYGSGGYGGGYGGGW